MNQMGDAETLEDLVSDPNGASLMDNMYESFKESFMADMIAAQTKDNYNSQLKATFAQNGVTLKAWDSLDDDEKISGSATVYVNVDVNAVMTGTPPEEAIGYDLFGNKEGTTYLTKQVMQNFAEIGRAHV